MHCTSELCSLVKMLSAKVAHCIEMGAVLNANVACVYQNAVVQIMI